MPASPRSASSASEDSTVTQDYLKAVWSVCEWGDAGASITGLSRRMGVAVSTASENVARLVDAGLLVHEPSRAVTLRSEGGRRATAIIRRHRLLETYLVANLGFTWDEVHVEAEELEHAVSDRLIDRIDAALGHPVRDPHGDPIPGPDGEVVVPRLRSIDTLRVGQTGVVGRIKDESVTLRHLTRAGIGLDTRVIVVERVRPGAPDASEGEGPRHLATVVRAVRPPGAPAAQGADAVLPAGTLWVVD